MNFKKSQSVFEYFIITATVAAAALVFANCPFWQNINKSCNVAFEKAVTDMAK
ncbi:MAG: hypothetical protein KAJ14_10885 [Candidatus Omnitrophica bacterium]|nr:hypothetical protein [Candidatus Omnitrophota bacterium]MCK5287802.1 hypothetical protein [Candidatus Omnitrophota bacterium]MCK5392708.1 hypothetical protein [Candidatus Omnitrophota bacterium]MCK5493604.1 hypothetical protein [Candidatus Omnitrophota bacterium]